MDKKRRKIDASYKINYFQVVLYQVWFRTDFVSNLHPFWNKLWFTEDTAMESILKKLFSITIFMEKWRKQRELKQISIWFANLMLHPANIKLISEIRTMHQTKQICVA